MSDVFRSTSNEFWTLHTSDDTLVGFAALSPRLAGKHLELICSMRGEGLRLFRELLMLYQEYGLAYVELEAVTPDVANGYLYTAHKANFDVTHGLASRGQWSTRLDRAVSTDDFEKMQNDDDLLPMTIWLRKESIPAFRKRTKTYVRHVNEEDSLTPFLLLLQPLQPSQPMRTASP